jgi:hypothetical protein
MVPGDTGDESGTMIQHATLIPRGSGDTSEIESNLGTMVINEDSDEDTMKRTLKQAPFMSLVRIADWVD